MKEKTILWRKLANYTESEQIWIKKAYFIAKHVHKGQKRKSGEDYIIHPIEVALTLIALNADVETVCAGLLHDVVEDTNLTYDDLAKEFNKDVADLVEGVTKINEQELPKHAQKQASFRKLMTYFSKDVRVIVIKLADRLHNMRTLEFMKPKKQIEKAYETLHEYVPFAYKIGAYEIKNILEDLSYQYLQPKRYQKILHQLKKYEQKQNPLLEELKAKVKNELKKQKISFTIKQQTKNIFGISKKLQKEKSLPEIHDLFGIQLIVSTVEECYKALNIIHQICPKCAKYEHDYIKHPKTNKYQSLHTTIFYKNQYIQFQIRTNEMDIISSKGLMGYWSIYGPEARLKMQQDIEKYGFKFLWEMNQKIKDNEEYLTRLRKEIFGKQIFVFDRSGVQLALPAGATVVDFAYQIHTDIGNHMWKAIVNGVEVPLNQILRTNDHIQVITHEKALAPKETMAITFYAKERIRKFYRLQNEEAQIKKELF